MSWFKKARQSEGSPTSRLDRFIGRASSSSSSPKNAGSRRSSAGSHGSVSLASGGNSSHQSTPSPQLPSVASNDAQLQQKQLDFEGRPRAGTDPETCLEVFKSHWGQACSIISKSTGVRRSAQEEIEAVMHYADQMTLLMVEEEEEAGGQGPILQYLLEEDILESLLTWSAQSGPEYSDRITLHHLKMFEVMISQSRQPLFVHKPLIRPLLRLLSACEEHSNPSIETRLCLVLHQLCVCVTQNTQMLELLFSASGDQGPAKFVIFSLLIPYIHREGQIGQQARDALLLIMSLSSIHDHIGRYIADNSDFCPVLATGLSGLYSSLKRKLDYPSDDWHQLTQDDVNAMPELTMFLNSLEFCNAVIQVSHSIIRKQLLLFIYQGFIRPQLGPDLFQVSHRLVRQQLVTFIYNGFLVPVIAPALHQDIFKLPISLVESYFGHDFFHLNDVEGPIVAILEDSFKTSMEEVIAATAYLDLFLRKITEPALLHTFLKFILTEKHDDLPILESLISRINSNSRLCMVTLSLFKTMVELNCEDVMFQLIFKHLIPCTHVMVSQRRAVKDLDFYSKTAEKLLTLKPAACTSDYSETPDVTATQSAASSRSSSPTNTPSTPRSTRFPWKPSFSSPRERSQSVISDAGLLSNASPDHFSLHNPTFGTRLEHYETDYFEYLHAARPLIRQCAMACMSWSAPYDGENPSPDSLFNTAKIEPVLDSSPDSTQATETNQAQSQQAANEVESKPDSNLLTCSKSESESNSIKPNQHLDKTLVVKSLVSQECCGDSTVSEADSAMSGSSLMAENLQTTACDVTNPESRTDSPLNDNFDNEEFRSFLLSLKRVKTPVEFCDNLEECLNEIDSVVDKVKLIQVTPKWTLSSSLSKQSCDLSSPNNQSDQLRAKSNRFSMDFGDVEVERMTSFDSTLNLHQIEPLSRSTSVSADGIQTSGFSSLRQSSSSASAFTPTKYNLGHPDIGPFLTTLLSKLECMMQNSLYVNLLLTGLVTRLACYPQPLLRSFLLNHTLVFQPTVKSLVQVLGSVKHKVDCYSYQVKEFDALLLKARRFMAWREETVLRGVESPVSATPVGNRSRTASLAEMHKEKKRGSFSDFLFRRNQPQKTPQPRLQFLGDKKGFRYINRQSPTNESQTDVETLKTKNAVYCALVLEEFVKELAAISQEHSVLIIASQL